MKETFKIVMLPTEKAENSLYLNGSNKLSYHKGYLTQEYLKDSLNAKSHHLYIISDDEIKEGDWYLWERVWGSNIWEIQRAELSIKGVSSEHHKKIVATTDELLYSAEYDMRGEQYERKFALPTIPFSFIQDFVQFYNQGKPIVEVDLDMELHKWLGSKYPVGQRPTYQIKIEPDNTVVVHKIKIYSREEVVKLFYKNIEDRENPKSSKYGGIDKWIQDNL